MKGHERKTKTVQSEHYIYNQGMAGLWRKEEITYSEYSEGIIAKLKPHLSIWKIKWNHKEKIWEKSSPNGKIKISMFMRIED